MLAEYWYISAITAIRCILDTFYVSNKSLLCLSVSVSLALKFDQLFEILNAWTAARGRQYDGMIIMTGVSPHMMLPVPILKCQKCGVRDLLLASAYYTKYKAIRKHPLALCHMRLTVSWGFLINHLGLGFEPGLIALSSHYYIYLLQLLI